MVSVAQRNENQLTFLSQSSLVKRNYRMMQGLFSNLVSRQAVNVAVCS